MKPIEAMLVMVLLLGGCGSCQRGEQARHPGGGAGAAATTPPAASTPVRAAAKIHVAPIQPTAMIRQGRPPQPAGAGQSTATRARSAGPGAGVAGQEQENPEDDCFVVADADPDWGPPPLEVEFSAEADCSAGEAKYSWDFGDGSAPSTEANPSHTYTTLGDYTASVTVTGPHGATSTDEIDITVEED
ncbi:MAG: PKD domain-containing protein [Candidatus Binatia bacterium]